MEDALAQATEDQKEKLTRAVEKNKVRVDSARQSLEDARKQLILESSDQTDGGKS
jgi:electron transport complex protein RnfC